MGRTALLLAGFDPGGVSRGLCDVISLSSFSSWGLSSYDYGLQTLDQF